VFISFKYFCSVNTAANKEDDGTTVAVLHIVLALVSGFIFGIFFSYIVSCTPRRSIRNRKSQSNPDPKPTEVDPTYQELDLSKMMTEDNCQSLRVIPHAEDNVPHAEDKVPTLRTRFLTLRTRFLTLRTRFLL
jgi:hypothetical protein